MSAYGIAKLAAEAYVEGWNRIHGTTHAVLRFANVYGPRQSAELEGGVVSIFMERLARGEETLVFGDGEQSSDYVYVGDVVDAVLAATGRGGVYNVGTGVETTVSELHRLCAEVAGSAQEPRHVEPRAGRCPPQRARSRAREPGARLERHDTARRGPTPDVGLSALAKSSAGTLVAIRAVVWIGTALSLVWAPYVGVLFGDAYGAWSNLLFRTFAQWDARWFVQISERGYAEVPQAAAFFPLYPALVHGLEWVTGSTLVAGTLISLASAAVAAAVLAELARKLLGDRAARDAVLYLALYPVAFVFTAVYSDALFLALAAASFLAAERGRRVLAGVLVGLATGTRIIGLALVPALALLLWRGRGGLLRLAPLLLAPAAVGLYALYLDRELGDADAFATAQTDWDRDAATLGPLGGAVDAVQAAGRGLKELARAERRVHAGAHGLALERDAPRAARRRRLAHLDRVAAGRPRVRRLQRGDAARDPLGARDGLPARQPAALPARRLPALPRARRRHARAAARAGDPALHLRRARRGGGGRVLARRLDRLTGRSSAPGDESEAPWTTRSSRCRPRGARRPSSSAASQPSSSSS